MKLNTQLALWTWTGQNTMMEKIAGATSDAIAKLQMEVAKISKVTLQNKMTLDMMLASHGGMCAVINSSCYTYIDETGKINVDLEIIKQQLGILQEIKRTILH